MTISNPAVSKLAGDNESAWISKSPDAVASFYADDSEVVITAAIRGLDARADCDDVFESPLDFR